jgi:phage terminase small subunit
MPRKSAAANLAIIPGTPRRLAPPRELDATERKIFADLIAASSPDAFRASDLPLLATYCRAISLETRSASELAAGDDKALQRWTQACKVMSTMAARLGLSPQSRQPHMPTRPQSLKPTPHTAGSYYDRPVEDE